MALIKNEIPILEYDTDENAVIDTKAEGLPPFPEKRSVKRTARYLFPLYFHKPHGIPDLL